MQANKNLFLNNCVNGKKFSKAWFDFNYSARVSKSLKKLKITLTIAV